VEQSALTRAGHAGGIGFVAWGGSERLAAHAQTRVVKISFDASALRSIQWHQYVVRFALGGLVTVIAGLLAKAFGPVFGGLFLAFPAIFPASVTLIAKRERKKKEQHGLSGDVRGRRAAALDAAGSVLGAIGLGCFAAVVWKALPEHRLASVLCAAGALWLVVSSCLWWLRKKHWISLPGTRADS